MQNGSCHCVNFKKYNMEYTLKVKFLVLFVHNSEILHGIFLDWRAAGAPRPWSPGSWRGTGPLSPPSSSALYTETKLRKKSHENHSFFTDTITIYLTCDCGLGLYRIRV
jgi:hypothetical protein